MPVRLAFMFGSLVGIAILLPHGSAEVSGVQRSPGHVAPQTSILKPADADVDMLPHIDVYRRIGTGRFRTGDGILSLAFSPNGKIIASGVRNGPVCLWDAHTGQRIRQLNEYWVWALAFSEDGRFLATGGASKLVRLWDIEHGKEVVQMRGHEATIKALAFSRDGAALVSAGDDNKVRLWRADNGMEVVVHDGHSLGVGAVAVSPDVKHFASASLDRTIRVWEFAAQPVELRAPAAVTAMAYLADRKSVIGGCDDGFVRIWDIQSAKQVREWRGHNGGIMHLTLSQDKGTVATSGADDTIRIWDVTTGNQIREIRRRLGEADALAISADGSLVACAGLNNSIRIWETKTGRPQVDDGVPDSPVTSLAYCAKGTLAAAAYASNQVRLYELPSGREVGRIVCGPEDAELLLAVTPDGHAMATANGENNVVLWDVASRRETRRLETAERDEARCMTFTPSGKNLAVGYRRGGLRIWDAKAGKVQKVVLLPNAARALAYSQDGKFLAVASDHEITIRDTDAYEVIRRLAKLDDAPACLAFSPDGRWLAAGMYSGVIRLFNLNAPKEIEDLEIRDLTGHRGVVNSLAWSVNGRCLVSGGYDKTVRLWEFVNGAPIAVWPAHSGEVTSVAFHPSSRTLMSGSRDTTVLLWDSAGLGISSKAPATIPMEADALESLWIRLASDNNLEGNGALWSLVFAKDNAEFLSKKIFKEDPRKIKQYIDDLNSAAFKVRENAYAALARYERWIEGHLTATLKNPPSEEVRQRVQLLLKRLATKDSLSLDRERLRARRVIEVLEQTNTPSAVALLGELAAGAAEEELRHGPGGPEAIEIIRRQQNKGSHPTLKRDYPPPPNGLDAGAPAFFLAMFSLRSFSAASLASDKNDIADAHDADVRQCG